MRVSGNSRRNWQLPHACWQGPNHTHPSGDETGWTTTRLLGEVGAMSVHSKPACVCSDCTFLKRDATRRQHFSRSFPRPAGVIRELEYPPVTASAAGRLAASPVPRMRPRLRISEGDLARGSKQEPRPLI